MRAVSTTARTETTTRRQAFRPTPPYRPGHDEPATPARARIQLRAGSELATVREAMRELHRLLASLDDGQLEKVVLCQKNQMRAVILSIERYSQLAAPDPSAQRAA